MPQKPPQGGFCFLELLYNKFMEKIKKVGEVTIIKIEKDDDGKTIKTRIPMKFTDKEKAERIAEELRTASKTPKNTTFEVKSKHTKIK